MGAIAGTARSYKGSAMCRSAPWARSRARPAPTRDWQCVGAPHGHDRGHGPLLPGIGSVCRSAPWARSRARPAPTRDWQCVGAPHGRDRGHGPLLPGAIIAETAVCLCKATGCCNATMPMNIRYLS